MTDQKPLAAGRTPPPLLRAEDVGQEWAVSLIRFAQDQADIVTRIENLSRHLYSVSRIAPALEAHVTEKLLPMIHQAAVDAANQTASSIPQLRAELAQDIRVAINTSVTDALAGVNEKLDRLLEARHGT
jgi:molybdenum cofactor biosynthesis enzyme